MDEVMIRPGRNGDVNFIANSWLRSYRGTQGVVGCPSDVYYYYHRRILEHLIPRSVVKVICNRENSDQILGWICCEPSNEALVVHMLYVKKPFRHRGLANLLLDHMAQAYPHDAVIFTHKTHIFWTREEPRFLDKIRERGYVYIPYLAYVGLPEGWWGGRK